MSAQQTQTRQENQRSKQNQSQNQRDEIQKKAYELAQQRGFEPGHELDDWLEAERIVVVTAVTIPEQSESGARSQGQGRQEQQRRQEQSRQEGRSRF